MTYPTTFASRLREIREERNLSKSELARLVGVTTTCVWNWEEGNTNPRTQALSKLASALSSSESYLQHGVHQQKDDIPVPEKEQLKVLGGKEMLEDVVRRAKQEIALAAGLSETQVKVILEFGS